MTITPRSEIRTWIREQVDAGRSKDDITTAAIDHFLDREDIVAGLVTDVIKAETTKVFDSILIKSHRAPDRTKAAQKAVAEEVATLPATSPLAKLSPKVNLSRTSDILLDLAKMTRSEVLNMAYEFDGEAQRNDELAAFCRAVAAELRDGERVSERFTQDTLLRMRSRITTHSKVAVFVGERQIALTERTN